MGWLRSGASAILGEVGLLSVPKPTAAGGHHGGSKAGVGLRHHRLAIVLRRARQLAVPFLVATIALVSGCTAEPGKPSASNRGLSPTPSATGAEPTTAPPSSPIFRGLYLGAHSGWILVHVAPDRRTDVGYVISPRGQVVRHTSLPDTITARDGIYGIDEGWLVGRYPNGPWQLLDHKLRTHKVRTVPAFPVAEGDLAVGWSQQGPAHGGWVFRPATRTIYLHDWPAFEGRYEGRSPPDTYWWIDEQGRPHSQIVDQAHLVSDDGGATFYEIPLTSEPATKLQSADQNSVGYAVDDMEGRPPRTYVSVVQSGPLYLTYRIGFGDRLKSLWVSRDKGATWNEIPF